MSDTEGKDDDRASSIAGSSTLFLAFALGVLMLLAWRLSDVLLLLFGAGCSACVDLRPARSCEMPGSAAS